MRPFVLAAMLGLAVTVAACAESSGATAPPSDAGQSESAARDATSSDSAAADVASPKPDAPACTLDKPYATKDVDCNACAERACCQPINECYADSTCDDGYVNCLLACVLLPSDAGADASAADAGVDACKTSCATDFPTGKAAYDALSACVDTECAVECQ